MCYENDAVPPVPDIPEFAVRTSREPLRSADGTPVPTFRAHPAERKGSAVLLLPDNLGLREFYEQLAVGLAQRGHPAIAIDYYARSAPDAPLTRKLAELRRDTLFDDFDAAIAALGGNVVSLGFCLGGRFAFQTAAARFGLSGAIGFYGAVQPIRDAPGPTQLAPTFTAPILGIFGGADEGIPPELVAGFDQALTVAGVAHEIVTYPGAPHGFFDASVDGFAEESADAWRRVERFLDDHAEGL
ncbi:dienelactone hydrolase family protein [Kutzneria sp. CA-103260]|uniref:dienelactone hydrolase family protein n=1 Tax=Kutzneria sp. CA-103260 TaxID=2802641 RepID=UPI001BACF637|nr:dienelactone hydrolase family protein [Kutzneria sp. CA-103260]QUQ72561.1 Carboxymethylenebutenolidase [Kutzneria sp. CA-103260]